MVFTSFCFLLDYSAVSEGLIAIFGHVCRFRVSSLQFRSLVMSDVCTAASDVLSTIGICLLGFRKFFNRSKSHKNDFSDPLKH